jgi:hypothetical protein
VVQDTPTDRAPKDPVRSQHAERSARGGRASVLVRAATSAPATRAPVSRPAVGRTVGGCRLAHQLVDAVGRPLLRSVHLIGWHLPGRGRLVDTSVGCLLEGVRDGGRIDVVGLRHLGERLALKLLAKLIGAHAKGLRRRVEPATHALLVAGTRATTLPVIATVRATARTAIAGTRAATIRDARVRAGLVHRLLELVGRDAEPGSERGDELLFVLLSVGLLTGVWLPGVWLTGGGRRLLRGHDAEAGSDQRDRGHTRHGGALH